MGRIPKPSPAMAVAMAALVIGLGGVAFATIPDSAGVIHGCYGKRGDLRVVESARECGRKETPIKWNQKGNPGPPGQPGGGSNGARTYYAEVAAEESTTSQAYTDLTTPGPSIQVDVPANSLINIHVEVDLKAEDAPQSEAQVGVFEATDFPEVQGPFAVTGSTTFVRNPNGGGAFLFPATPGVRTYVLKYKSTFGTVATFRNRRLWITVLPSTQVP